MGSLDWLAAGIALQALGSGLYVRAAQECVQQLHAHAHACRRLRLTW